MRFCRGIGGGSFWCTGSEQIDHGWLATTSLDVCVCIMYIFCKYTSIIIYM